MLPLHYNAPILFASHIWRHALSTDHALVISHLPLLPLNCYTVFRWVVSDHVKPLFLAVTGNFEFDKRVFSLNVTHTWHDCQCGPRLTSHQNSSKLTWLSVKFQWLILCWLLQKGTCINKKKILTGRWTINDQPNKRPVSAILGYNQVYLLLSTSYASNSPSENRP